MFARVWPCRRVGWPAGSRCYALSFAQYPSGRFCVRGHWTVRQRAGDFIAAGRADGIQISPKKLTYKIQECASINDVDSLCKRHENVLNEIHVAVAWQKVGSLTNATICFEGMASLVQATVRLLVDAGPRGIATVAYGVARARYYSPLLLDTLTKRANERITDFNSRDLANTVWAFAKLNHAEPMLFEAVAHVGVERLANFNAQDFANTVWAFAKLSYVAPKLFDAVAREAVGRLTDFTPQNLANTVWAFAEHSLVFRQAQPCGNRALRCSGTGGGGKLNRNTSRSMFGL